MSRGWFGLAGWLVVVRRARARRGEERRPYRARDPYPSGEQPPGSPRKTAADEVTVAEILLMLT